MEHEKVTQQFIQQIGAAFAALAVVYGVALASGAPGTLAFGGSLATLGLMLFWFWGVPRSIDVLAHWREFTDGRLHAGDADEQTTLLGSAVYEPTTREIVVHGRGGGGVLTMVEFPDLHEQAWREALARFLFAAQSEGSLKIDDLVKYVSHRRDVIAFTDVLKDARLVTKGPGSECRLAYGVTFHQAIRRVTRLTSPLPLPNGLPPNVRTAGTTDQSELVLTGPDRRELLAG